MFVVGSRELYYLIGYDSPSDTKILIWSNNKSLSRGHSQHETTLSITPNGTSNLAVLLLYRGCGLPTILSIVSYGANAVDRNISGFDIQRRCKDHDRYSRGMEHHVSLRKRVRMPPLKR